MALPDGTSFTFTQQDKNTTYITGTPDTSGLTKLYQSTGSSTDGTITQAAITSALDSKADTSGTYTGLTVGNANADIFSIIPTLLVQFIVHLFKQILLILLY